MDHDLRMLENQRWSLKRWSERKERGESRLLPLAIMPGRMHECSQPFTKCEAVVEARAYAAHFKGGVQNVGRCTHSFIHGSLSPWKPWMTRTNLKCNRTSFHVTWHVRVHTCRGPEVQEKVRQPFDFALNLCKLAFCSCFVTSGCSSKIMWIVFEHDWTVPLCFQRFVVYWAGQRNCFEVNKLYHSNLATPVHVDFKIIQICMDMYDQFWI